MRITALALVLCLAPVAIADEKSSSTKDPVVESTAKALDALVRTLFEPSKDTSNVHNASGVGRTLVAQALTALAMKAHPDTQRWERPLKRLDRELRAFIYGGMSVQETWPLAVTSLYFAERAHRGRASKRSMEELVYRLEAGQNKEGGWAHGSQITEQIDFYPSTLMSSTAACMGALGALERAGADVDPDVVDAAFKLLNDVQGPHGALPYGGRAYRKGFEAGRTAAGAFALAALGRTEDDAFLRAAAYVREHVTAIPRGHASAAWHTVFGALGCHAAGRDTFERYKRDVLGPLLRTQADDGHFAAPVPSPDDMTFMGSEASRKSYTTAAVACALLSDRLEVVKRIPKAPARLPGIQSETRLPTRAPLWSALAMSRGVVRSGPHAVAASHRPGELEAYVGTTGKRAWRATSKSARSANARGTQLIGAADGRIVAVFARVEPGRAVIGSTGSGVIGGAKVSSIVAAFDVKGRELWSTPVDNAVLAIDATKTRVLILARGGAYEVRSLDDGTLLGDGQGPKMIVNGSGALIGDDVVLAGESRVVRVTVEGSVLWTAAARSIDGLAKHTFGGVVATEDAVVAAATNGRVYGLDPRSGKERFALSVGSAPEAVAMVDGRVLVVGFDGTATLIDGAKGEVVWRRSLPRGDTSERRASIAASSTVVGVSSGALRGVVLLRLTDGEALARLDVEHAASVAMDEERAYVASVNGVVAFPATEDAGR